MTRELLAALAIASATLAAPAFAAQETPKISLKTSDLDLSTPDGQKVAKERIDVAAKSACTAVMVGSRMGTLDRDCYRDVTKRLTERLSVQQASKGAAAQSKAVDQAPER